MECNRSKRDLVKIRKYVNSSPMTVMFYFTSEDPFKIREHCMFDFNKSPDYIKSEILKLYPIRLGWKVELLTESDLAEYEKYINHLYSMGDTYYKYRINSSSYYKHVGPQSIYYDEKIKTLHKLRIEEIKDV